MYHSSISKTSRTFIPTDTAVLRTPGIGFSLDGSRFPFPSVFLSLSRCSSGSRCFSAANCSHSKVVSTRKFKTRGQNACTVTLRYPGNHVSYHGAPITRWNWFVLVFHSAALCVPVRRSLARWKCEYIHRGLCVVALPA